MLKYFNFIKVIFVLLFIISLYAFSSFQSNSKSVSSVNIDFIGEKNLYISKSSIDKLLIQNNDYIECLEKDIIDLNELEERISSHEMIQNAEVYLTVKGGVRVDVEQRKPLARVISNPSYYLDEYGKKMPLSIEHSARVLLVHGQVDQNNLEIIFEMVNTIQNDSFLKLYITDVFIDSENKISMNLRDCDFKVLVGDLNQLKQKIKNFKAFYQIAKKDNTLKKYKKVNLKFDKQVIGVK